MVSLFVWIFDEINTGRYACKLMITAGFVLQHQATEAQADAGSPEAHFIDLSADVKS